ncbi:MAG: MazG family protein [Lachnospiraceae bacterium]|nr:MazG family protein [Lachnospiraceae bacterium]
MNPEAKKIAEKKGKYTVDDLRAVMRLLRSPEGCPWDREQTHESIRKNLIEEAYEAAEAIDLSSPEMLREELGDLLLQVVYHTCMAEEEGTFSFEDAADEVTRKMISRHPHIFGELTLSTSAEVSEMWEKVKAETKHRETPGEVLDAVAKTLPALMRAEKIAKKAKKASVPFPVEPDASFEDADGLARRLLALAAGAQEKGIDAEEALSSYLTRYTDTVLENEKNRN